MLLALALASAALWFVAALFWIALLPHQVGAECETNILARYNQLQANVVPCPVATEVQCDVDLGYGGVDTCGPESDN